MDLISTIFDKNTNIIKEAFSHITKYSNGEVIITDEKLNIIFQNSKYNFKKGKFDISILAFDDKKQKLKKSFENFQKADKKHIFLKLIFKNDIQNIPMDVHICKIFNKRNKVKGYSIILQDITQEIKNRIQKETFIDILTHDLKNPMRANIQILELILNGKFGKLDNNLKSILDELLNSCKFMNYMTDNLLIKYKNEFSLNELQKQTYSIIELVKDKAHELSKVLERKNQTIELVIKSIKLTLCLSMPAVTSVPNILPANPPANEVAKLAPYQPKAARFDVRVALRRKFPARPAPTPHKAPEIAPPIYPEIKLPPLDSVT